jgi:hypothetical protein
MPKRLSLLPATYTETNFNAQPQAADAEECPGDYMAKVLARQCNDYAFVAGRVTISLHCV